VFFSIYFKVLLYYYTYLIMKQIQWFVLVFVLEYLLNYGKYQKFLISKYLFFFVKYSNAHLFYLSVYQIKPGLELFRNLNMFINNHIQIHQHQTMIEFVIIIKNFFFFEKNFLCLFRWHLNIFHGYYFH
jgi:hypothetical protein